MFKDIISKLANMVEQRFVHKNKLKILHNELDLIMKEQSHVLRHIESARETVNKSKKRIAFIELEVKSLDERENLLKKRERAALKQREIDSLRHEIVNIQGNREELEDEEMQLILDVEKLEKKMSSELSGINDQLASFDTKIKQIQEAISTVHSAILPIDKEMISVAEKLPAEIKDQYKRIAHRLDRPVVIIKDCNCTGCFSSIAAKTFSEIKNVGYGYCRECNRLLFFEKA